jgi:hypothetical protein
MPVLVSEIGRTGKGGRPSRPYRLSGELIQMNFPSRDYQLHARIAIESMMDLGDAGKTALNVTGRVLVQELNRQEQKEEDLSFNERFFILKGAALAAGFSPEFSMHAKEAEFISIFTTTALLKRWQHRTQTLSAKCTSNI